MGTGPLEPARIGGIVPRNAIRRPAPTEADAGKAREETSDAGNTRLPFDQHRMGGISHASLAAISSKASRYAIQNKPASDR